MVGSDAQNRKHSLSSSSFVVVVVRASHEQSVHAGCVGQPKYQISSELSLKHGGDVPGITLPI